MPFCSQCGNQVRPNDIYCGRCGGRQPSSTPPPPLGTDALASLPPRTAAILCYIPAVGWIAAIIVLAAARFRHDRLVRFHAFQGLYLFVAWLMDDWVLRPMAGLTMPHMPVHKIVQAALLVASIFMMVKASHDEAYALPIFGELAQRSLVED